MTPPATALWRPPGAVGGGWRPTASYAHCVRLQAVTTASCAHCVRLQAVTIMSPFGWMTPPAAAMWRPPGAIGGGWHPPASCAHYVRLQAVTIMSPFGRCRWWVASYRQLRSLRSLASGYGYVALRADDAACGGFVASEGRYIRPLFIVIHEVLFITSDHAIPKIQNKIPRKYKTKHRENAK